MEIIENLFRNLMFFFDNIIYGLIPTIYKLFIYLSEINLYSNDESNPLFQLVQHVYVLLGIFMLFKVSFSLLQYIVDPNAFRDSSKGMGKLVTNVLVALVLLVAVPYIFSAASELQTVIIQKNVIGQLILGTNASSNDDGTDLDVAKAEEMAKDLQFMLYGAFYRVDESVSACSGTSGVFGSIDVANQESGACLDYLNTGISEENNAVANGVNLYSFFKHAPGAQEGENCNGNVCDDRNFQDFGTLLWWKDNGNYVIDYLPFISSAVGVYVVFLLISFSVDIAVRAIKLCFLQMVAPVAIVSYIDPKESISNGKLHNWIKESASTYFSLFLRLATIFFVMLLVQLIASSVLSDGQGQSYVSSQMVDESYNIWIYLFLVIGAFMFAKQVPKLIESIFGIKGSGDFSLNPFKNEGFGALAGGAVGLGIGIAGAATGSGIGRVASGAIGGFKAGLGGKKVGEIANMQADTNRRLGIAKSNGSTFFGRLGARVSSTLGTPGAMGNILNQKRTYDNQIQEFENKKQEIENKIAPTRMQIANNSTTMSDLNAMRARAIKKIEEGNGKEGKMYQEMLRQAAEAETSGNGARAEQLRQDAARLKNTEWADSWVTDNLNREDGDLGLKSLYAKATSSAMISGHKLVDEDNKPLSGKALDSLSKKISGENTEYEISIASQEHEIKNIDDEIRTVRVNKAKLDEPERKARANIEAVQGKEGGPRGRMPHGPGGPRGPRF